MIVGYFVGYKHIAGLYFLVVCSHCIQTQQVMKAKKVLCLLQVFGIL